jgi:pSer/pThr/pTyr-binding forkhead associated (FHA) protein
MTLCNHCSHDNRAGMMFCEECGRELRDDVPRAPLSTYRLVEIGRTDAAEDGKSASITLRLRGAAETIILYNMARIVLGREGKVATKGRQDPVTPSSAPDLDLTPYGAVEKGVSRYHATLELESGQATLVDEHSANGTFVNGQRLNPHKPMTLHNGDEIRLGSLVATLFVT